MDYSAPGPDIGSCFAPAAMIQPEGEGCAETASPYPTAASQGLLISRTLAANVPGKHA